MNHKNADFMFLLAQRLRSEKAHLALNELLTLRTGTGSVQFRYERKYEAYALKSGQNRKLLRRLITD